MRKNGLIIEAPWRAIAQCLAAWLTSTARHCHPFLAGAEADVEYYRVDAADGCAYTKTEFMAEYSGLDQWHASLPLGLADDDGSDRHDADGRGREQQRDWNPTGKLNQPQPQHEWLQQQLHDRGQDDGHPQHHTSTAAAGFDGRAPSGRTDAVVAASTEQVDRLIEMGFSRERVVAAMAQARGDSEAAMELLLANLC